MLLRFVSRVYLVEFGHHEAELAQHIVQIVVHLTHPVSQTLNLYRNVLCTHVVIFKARIKDNHDNNIVSLTWLSIEPRFLLDLVENSSVWVFT